MKQCKIYDIENELFHGALLMDDGNAICACCGGILPADELDETWKIVETYEFWVDFTDMIVDD